MRFSFHSSSPLDALLQKRKPSLTLMLLENEVVEEVRSNNKKLLEFLMRPDMIKILLTIAFATEEVVNATLEAELQGETTDLTSPSTKNRCILSACEILTCENDTLLCSITDRPEILQHYISFLHTPVVFTTVQSAYYVRLFGLLMGCRLELMMDFVKGEDNFLQLVLPDGKVPLLQEILLKLVFAFDEDQAVLADWIVEEGIMGMIVERLGPDYDSETHELAAQCVLDIVAMHAAPTPSHIPGVVIRQFMSDRFAEAILQNALLHPDKCLSHGVAVIVEILNVLVQKLLHAQQIDDECDSDGELPPRRVEYEVPSMVDPIIRLMPDFTRVLKKDPPPLHPSRPTPPLGINRLKIINMYSALLRTGFPMVFDALLSADYIQTCLDLFFKYPDNNFLHAAVHNMIHTILMSPSLNLRLSLCLKWGLCRRILEAVKENNMVHPELWALRRGYMGHITLITNDIVRTSLEDQTLIESIDRVLPAWELYVDTHLREVNEMEGQPLGGQKPLLSETDADLLMDDPKSFDPEGDGPDAGKDPILAYTGHTSNAYMLEDYDLGEMPVGGRLSLRPRVSPSRQLAADDPAQYNIML
eukprot:GCRY01003633.1.p1 GENE.GCRY01003633.1~~GCRY01003633.1.p1  ORF type:complete len:588 (-),score=130.15 GCRY01003633.1:289-2052(-)